MHSYILSLFTGGMEYTAQGSADNDAVRTWLQHLSFWQRCLWEQRSGARVQRKIHFFYFFIFLYFCRGQECFWGLKRTQQTPSLSLGAPPRLRSPRQGDPSARRWRPTSVLAVAALWAQLGNPARLPKSLELRAGILINKRECQRALGARRIWGAAQKPRRRRLLNPCQILTFPKLETPEQQPP